MKLNENNLLRAVNKLKEKGLISSSAFSKKNLNKEHNYLLKKKKK